MANDLVRVRFGDIEKTMGRALAESTEGIEILPDGPTKRPDGRPLPTTRAGGRRRLPRTTVAKKAAAKKATGARKPRKPATTPQAVTTPPPTEKENP